MLQSIYITTKNIQSITANISSESSIPIENFVKRMKQMSREMQIICFKHKNGILNEIKLSFKFEWLEETQNYFSKNSTVKQINVLSALLLHIYYIVT